MRSHHQAAAHRFAMQPLSVAQSRLDRVAKGVAKIEDGSQTRLPLILPHHPSLDFATALNRVG